MATISLTLYDTSQFTVGTAGSVAEIFGLKRENVRVISTYVGGGFGGKGSLWPYIQLAVLAARMIGRPVRIALTQGGRFPARRRPHAIPTARGNFVGRIRPHLCVYP